MGTMRFKDMLREAGFDDINHFRQLRDQHVVGNANAKKTRLGELIDQHGLDFRGLIDEIDQGIPDESEAGMTLRGFLNQYYSNIKDGSLDASPEQIGKWGFALKILPLFANVTPEQIATARWPLDFSDDKMANSLKSIMSKPEFQKGVLSKLDDIFNWGLVVSAMPNLSREDAEYVVGGKNRDMKNWVLRGRMPKEVSKAFIRQAADLNTSFDTSTTIKKGFPQVMSEMMDDGAESPKVKNYLYSTALKLSTSGSTSDLSSDATEADFRPLVHKIPASEFASVLEKTAHDIKWSGASSDAQYRENRFVGRLNENGLPPEHNSIVDEWARKNPEVATVRFINSGRYEKLSPSEIEDIFKKYATTIKTDPWNLNKPSMQDMAGAVSLLPKDAIDRLVEENRNHPELLGTLGMWKYMNLYGEQPSNQELQERTESFDGFLANKIRIDHAMRKNGATTSFVTPEDLEKASWGIRNPKLAMQIVTHPNATPKAIENVFDSNISGDVYGLDRVVEGITGSYIDKVKESDKRAYLIEGNHGIRTDVRVGSTALRHLRDHLDERAAQGATSVRPEELPKGRTFNTLTRAVTDKKGNVQHVLDWNPLRDNRAGGNLTSAKATEAIDAMPVRPLMVRQSTLRWEGAQNHKAGGTSVLQFMPTKETLQHFKDNGLYTAFGEMSLDHMEDGTIHPTAPFHLGWVRYNIDHKTKEIFIDEIQSDLHSSFRKLMKRPSNKLKSQMQSVVDTLFGKHHPSEVLHEAAHQWFRDQGFEGYKIHIHGLKSKAHMSLKDQTKEPPAHFKEGYEAVPKKMGYTPAKYGDLSIETGDGEHKAMALRGMSTHGSNIVKFEELLFELSKGEW
jgi:hypothetical protein